MRSVRFDAELDRRVERAAKKLGVTVSDFIRTAMSHECDKVLADDEPKEDWKAVLAGSPHGDEWIKLLDGIVGSVEGDGASWEDRRSDWARVIREHNFRE